MSALQKSDPHVDEAGRCPSSVGSSSAWWQWMHPSIVMTFLRDAYERIIATLVSKNTDPIKYCYWPGTGYHYHFAHNLPMSTGVGWQHTSGTPSCGWHPQLHQEWSQQLLRQEPIAIWGHDQLKNQNWRVTYFPKWEDTLLSLLPTLPLRMKDVIIDLK